MRIKVIWCCANMADIEIIADATDQELALLQKFSQVDYDIGCTCEGKRCSMNSLCMCCETRFCGISIVEKAMPADWPTVNQKWYDELIYHLTELLEEH